MEQQIGLRWQDVKNSARKKAHLVGKVFKTVRSAR
jgi:hypothetical protein